MEELVRLYEERKVADLITGRPTSPQVLQQILNDAFSGDWMGDDAFRRRFQLKVSEVYYYPRVTRCAAMIPTATRL